jgi:O-antigen/teichoic acid export membrane protein
MTSAPPPGDAIGGQATGPGPQAPDAQPAAQVGAEGAVRAGAWSALDIFLRQGMQFAVTIAMARLLAPELFGIVALLTVFTALASVIVEAGPNIALQRHHGSTKVQESSIFWFDVGAGAAIALLLILAAPFVAAFYGFDVLRQLMLVSAAQVVTVAAGSVPQALLVRSLRFKPLFFVGAGAAVLSGAVGIGLAASGYGVWALSLQALTAALATTTMLWIVGGWRPAFAFNWRETRPLFRFGSHLVITGFLDVLYMQGFALIVGKLYGVRDLGLYNRAQQTQWLPSGVLMQIIGRVTLPLFATRTDDPEALRRAVRRSMRLTMVVNVPVMVGLAVLSDLVLVLLFGEAWRDAAPILSVLAVAGLLYPTALINLQALLAQDRSHYYLWLTVVKQGIGVLAVAVGSFFGIMGLAYAMVAYCLVGFVINAWPSRTFLGYGPLAQVKDLLPVFALGAAMGAAVMLVRPFLGFGAFLDLVALTAIGGGFYLGAALLLRIEALDDAMDLGLQLFPERIRRRLRVDRAPAEA